MRSDDFIGFLIFIALAVGSFVFRKIREGQEEQQRKNAPRQTRVEDLPEETRRTLYGDRGAANIPTATPRPGAPPPLPDAAREVLYREVMKQEIPRAQPRMPQAEEEGPVRPGRPQWKPAPAPLGPPKGPDHQEQMRRAYAERQRQLKLQRQEEERRRQQEQQRAEMLARAQRGGEGPSRPAPRAQRPRPPRSAPVAVPVQAPAAITSERLRDILDYPDSLRQAIILSEVLGPPRAFREIGSMI